MGELINLKNDQLEKKSNETDNLKLNLDETKSYADQAQDVATVIATKQALNDKKLVDDISNLKKDELTAAARANLKKGQAKNKDADKELQKSIFGIYEGLASYIGLKRDLPRIMLNILMFLIQPTLGLLIFITGLIVGTINVLMDGINSIVERFVLFTDATKKVVKSLLVICLIGIFIMVILAILEKFDIFIF